jgi:capsular polysaccharide biosynthesis protein
VFSHNRFHAGVFLIFPVRTQSFAGNLSEVSRPSGRAIHAQLPPFVSGGRQWRDLSVSTPAEVAAHNSRQGARCVTQEIFDPIQRGSSAVPTEDQEPAENASQATTSSLPPVIRVAIKRKKLVGIATLTIVALASAVALLLPSRYTATTVILPPQQGSSAGAAMMAQLSSLSAMAGAGAGALGIKNPNDLQVALLKSRSVEDAMVARFHLQSLYHARYLSSARKRWEKKTSIDNGLKDGLIRLSVTDRDPQSAADLANGWVEEYQRFSATLAVSEASERRLFLRAASGGRAGKSGARRRGDEADRAAHRRDGTRRPGTRHDRLGGHVARPGGGQAGRDPGDAPVCRRRESGPGARAGRSCRAWKGQLGRDGRGQRSPAATWWRPRASWARQVSIMRARCAR